MTPTEPRRYWMIVDQSGNAIDAYDTQDEAETAILRTIDGYPYRIIQVQEVPNG